eukprot:TRINITY_DN5107_c0_g2_i7.p1 TRINITY_DN5107_c0_g2~~TRINITY_DN5107_c0_g2_i7.p1  ORF type:complete len:273 (+),score=33.76 TRINITY_DN5107_c0_g2_i7:126-944(+)
MSLQEQTPVYPDLNGKRVLVTGGSSGIGRATALAFSKNGATVTIIARTVSKMEATVKEFTTKGYYAPADLTKPDEIKRAVVEAIDKMGGIDILINNGAVSNEDLDSPTNVNVLKHLLDIHVVGCMALIDACKDELLKNKGSVVNVSSALSEVIADQFIPYNIAKAAEDALTRNMAMNWEHIARLMSKQTQFYFCPPRRLPVPLQEIRCSPTVVSDLPIGSMRPCNLRLQQLRNDLTCTMCMYVYTYIHIKFGRFFVIIVFFLFGFKFYCGEV